MFKYLFLVLSISLIAGDIPQKIINIGSKTSLDLEKKLSSKLKEELQSNGLLSATKFCNKKAYTLTQDVNLHQVKGITVKRTSLKVRSPLNKALEDEQIVLHNMQILLNKKELPPYIITQNEGSYKYYKPLVIKKPLCLQCHGDISTHSELSRYIKENYPYDKATMYKMNDLRGVIIVEVKK